jgi:hypothetical protein
VKGTRVLMDLWIAYSGIGLLLHVLSIVLLECILIFGISLYTCRIGVSLFLENVVSRYRRIGIAVSVSRIGAT